jgi:hypothetical protein
MDNNKISHETPAPLDFQLFELNGFCIQRSIEAIAQSTSRSKVAEKASEKSFGKRQKFPPISSAAHRPRVGLIGQYLQYSLGATKCVVSQHIQCKSIAVD